MSKLVPRRQLTPTGLRCPACRAHAGRIEPQGEVWVFLCASCRNEFVCCGARTRKEGRCPNVPMENGKCRMHGGLTPTGPDSPHWKNGAYSKLPAEYVAAFEASVQDPDRIALYRDIAFVDSRIADLVGNLQTGESGKLWDRLKEVFTDFKASQREGRTEDAARALASIGRIIDKGGELKNVVAEIRSMQDHKRRLSQAEVRRQAMGRAVMTAEGAVAYSMLVQSIIRKHIGDHETLKAIQTDLQEAKARLMREAGA